MKKKDVFLKQMVSFTVNSSGAYGVVKSMYSKEKREEKSSSGAT